MQHLVSLNMQLLVSLNLQLCSALIFILDYVAEHDVFSCFCVP